MREYHKKKLANKNEKRMVPNFSLIIDPCLLAKLNSKHLPFKNKGNIYTSNYRIEQRIVMTMYNKKKVNLIQRLLLNGTIIYEVSNIADTLRFASANALLQKTVFKSKKMFMVATVDVSPAS